MGSSSSKSEGRQPLSQQITQPLFEGYLIKQSVFCNNLTQMQYKYIYLCSGRYCKCNRRRWTVINNGYLYTFKSKEYKSPTESLDLRLSQYVQKVPQSTKYCFDLFCAGNSYIFEAPNEETLNRWLKAVNQGSKSNPWQLMIIIYIKNLFFQSNSYEYYKYLPLNILEIIEICTGAYNPAKQRSLEIADGHQLILNFEEYSLTLYEFQNITVGEFSELIINVEKNPGQYSTDLPFLRLRAMNCLRLKHGSRIVINIGCCDGQEIHPQKVCYFLYPIQKL